MTREEFEAILERYEYLKKVEEIKKRKDLSKNSFDAFLTSKALSHGSSEKWLFIIEPENEIESKEWLKIFRKF